MTLASRMATKRAYKLQEFVAHASDVNCAKFGRQRFLITGGEDQNVNVWAVGKSRAILSLSGLTSPVKSVSFDSSEDMIGAGAASGTIKIWDIKEAKVARTLIGHRSNCASLDFHPFGELVASGSSDTNIKIWDMRNRRCIHTYQGHTQRIDALRFSPHGRWIVSGGADNSVKIWDLTAGKHLHDFSRHEGPVNCLDFHPGELLLATGSADKTVKFWDLETFELIGSAGPENCQEYSLPGSVVRSMTFNSDGKALFCGLHESLKVLSWQPVICHDAVDVGWSTLADLSVQEGKLLGCSYNQSCIGIWVVDLTEISPSAADNAESGISSMLGKLSISIGSATASNETTSSTLRKRPMSTSKEIPVVASPAATNRLSKAPETSGLRLTRAGSAPLLPPRSRFNPKSTDDLTRLTANVPSNVDLSTSAGMSSDNSQTAADSTYRPRSNVSAYSSKGPPFVPVVSPRHSSKVDVGSILTESTTTVLPAVDPENQLKGHLVMDHGKERRHSSITGEQSMSVNDEDEDVIAHLMEKHQEFIHGMTPRLTKLEMVYRCWQNNDTKGSLNAM